MKKNKVILIVAVLVLLAAVGAAVLLLTGRGDAKLKSYANKTEVAATKGYRFDLRISGSYGKNKNRINEIIIISNYNNTDKSINVTKVANGEDERREYLLKGGKYYEVNQDKLTPVENVLYGETDIFLLGVKNVRDAKQEKDQKIADTTYKVYTGTVKKNIINKMIKYTDLGFEVDEDASAEIWLTSDNQVYRVYYRVGDLTIYPSFFGYGKTNAINLDMYAKTDANGNTETDITKKIK